MVTAREFWRSTVNDFNPLGHARRMWRVFLVDRHEDDPTRSLLERLKVGLLNSIGQPQTYKGIADGASRQRQKFGIDAHRAGFECTISLSCGLMLNKALQTPRLIWKCCLVWASQFMLLLSAAGLNPADRLANDLVKSLAKFVRKYEERKGFTLKLDQLLKQVFAIALVAGASAVGGPPAAPAAGAAVVGAGQVFKTFRIELNVRDDLVKTLELPANRQEVIGALNEIIEDVQDKAGRPVARHYGRSRQSIGYSGATALCRECPPHRTILRSVCMPLP